jgi:hypothetical protein
MPVFWFLNKNNSLLPNTNGEAKVIQSNGRSLEPKELNLFLEHLPANFQEHREFMEIWEDWIIHRIEIRKHVTNRNAMRLMKKLVKYGPEISSKMICQSLENGWRGIFTLKGEFDKRSDSQVGQNKVLNKTRQPNFEKYTGIGEKVRL